ncbi:MAG: PQQ-dependent sugar dehydrogenase [Rhodospirillales bacterium]|nr:PQQ-dependent sugar dehydrogenase [Rhodospirillales bacterium]MDH3968306.1 PQQ-dependent sugar dehydrogenase [Rhodospirillales bacterium]
MIARAGSVGSLLLLVAVVLGAPRAAPAQSLTLEPIATGLARPVDIAHAGDGSGRLFIVLQGGRIVIHDGAGVLAPPFLDVTSLVSCCGERGLLGLAFHPDYASNGFFYVNYTDGSGDTVIARYRVSADPDLADPGSADILLTVAQPYTNHNGGQLRFGPDGFLYIGLGDGGSGGDPENRAQDLSELLGKILRIDVDGGPPYSIPPDNPFVGVAGARPEIWARGLRNPWRFSFDRLTGDLFIADVGQGAREEVDFQPAGSSGGENYGWRLMEGSSCFDPPAGCNDGSLALPIIEYGHVDGNCSITGGYRYRGARLPALAGQYLYADFCSGRLWTAAEEVDAAWTSYETLRTTARFSAFGENEAGDLYIAHLAQSAGTVYRIGFTTPSDHSGDNRADILWRNTDSGGTVLWQMNGFDREDVQSIGAPDPVWQVRGLADFDADAKADILWRNTVTGAAVIWLMDGFTKRAAGGIGAASLDWQVAGTGDFDGDAKADILWRNTTTGAALVWKMDGLSKAAAGGIGGAPLVWEVAGVGDFDTDAKSDILWRNTDSGSAVIWRMDGFDKLAAGTVGTTSLDWKVRGVGKFDRDGRSDILWRNTSNGNTVIWQMNGFSKEASASIGAPLPVWRVAGLGDTDGDGQSDIIWRDTGTGEVVAWRIDGLERAAAQAIGSVPLVWQVQ